MKQLTILFILFISAEIWTKSMAKEGDPVLQTGNKHHDQGFSAKLTRTKQFSKRGSPKQIDAFTTIQAEDFDEWDGVNVGGCSDPTTGGSQAQNIVSGDWFMFSDVDFKDGAYRVELRVATHEDFVTRGQIYLRFDSTEANPIALFETHNTLNYTWVTLSEYTLEIVPGVHDLYFTAESDDHDNNIVDINWFKFYAA